MPDATEAPRSNPSDAAPPHAAAAHASPDSGATTADEGGLGEWVRRKGRPITLNLLRIVTGFLFMQHGLPKVFGILGRPEAAETLSRTWFSGVLEVFGGFLVMIGLFVQPVAFILSGEMAFAYFLAHAPRGFWPVMNGGELAALYCFVFLYLATRGGGSFSLDGWRNRRKGGK
jgi:putative oxidoreductase